MKVRFTPRARRRAKLVLAWWRANRPVAPTLFEDELTQAIETLCEQPHAGTVYDPVAAARVRRLLLPKSEQHVYYVVDEAAEVVVIHTIWGARRGRGPKF